MQPSTYLKLIAGSLPDHGQGSVDDSLRLLAQEALGSANIHYIRSPHPVSGRYHYFALSSQALASEAEPETGLVAALPGHPQHQGPGVYVLDAGVYQVAALFDGEQLDVVCNEAELVTELLAEQDLPIFKVSAETAPWRFQSDFTRRNALIERLTQRVSKFSLSVLLLSGLAYGGLLAADGWLTGRVAVNSEAAAAALTAALREVKAGSPLTKQLADYQQRTSIAVRAGGWVDTYRLKGGVESFRIFAPSWITADYVKALGGVVADRDPVDEQLLILKKGDPDGGPRITSAETVAKPEAPEPAPAPVKPAAAR